MAMDKLAVLIPDGESDFALFVARCLAQVPHLKLRVLSSDARVPLRFSRHRRTYSCQPRGDNDERRLEVLGQAVKRTGADVILPVDESAVQFVSAHRQAVAELAAIPPVPDSSTLKKVTSKWLVVKLLMENGIPFPATIPCTTGGGLERDLNELPFPVLLKPTRGRGEEGIQRFDHPSEVLGFLREAGQGSLPE